MSCLRRIFRHECKYKKNLANDIRCELSFLQKYFFFLDFSRFVSPFYTFFVHYLYVLHSIYCQTLLINGKGTNNRRKGNHPFRPFPKSNIMLWLGRVLIEFQSDKALDVRVVFLGYSLHGDVLMREDEFL